MIALYSDYWNPDESKFILSNLSSIEDSAFPKLWTASAGTAAVIKDETTRETYFIGCSTRI
jgi:hypothetical protein